MSLAVIVLAAGKGTRMCSSLPKVLHRLAHAPMIAHVLRAVAELQPAKAVVVLAPGMEAVKRAAVAELPPVHFAEQAEQKGTGDAVACAMRALEGFKGEVLVVYGDTPLIRTESLSALLETRRAHNAQVALLAMAPDDPTGYGRLVMTEPPKVARIVECRDATPEEKSIRWVWGGVMAFDADFLREGLAQLQPSAATGEYYLTALIERGSCVMQPMDEEEAMGVNDRAQLAAAEAAMQARLRAKAMAEGATLIDPSSVFFALDTRLGRDVTVHPFVTFAPGVTVADGVEIRSFSHIEGASVGEGAIIGPFARLRPGAKLAEGVHIGNFVEVKNAALGPGAKANHLSYIGDAEVGAGANIGAGTITCNYDGVNKHKTTIGAGAFIGSNTSLVAPVSVGAGAVTGAGSVITQDVPEGALALERGEQVMKDAYRKITKSS